MKQLEFNFDDTLNMSAFFDSYNCYDFCFDGLVLYFSRSGFDRVRVRHDFFTSLDCLNFMRDLKYSAGFFLSDYKVVSGELTCCVSICE